MNSFRLVTPYSGALLDLVHDAVGQVGDRDVEAVVHRRLAVRLGVPDIERLAQGRALGLDGEIDVHGGAAEGRGLMAGEEVVGGDGAAERHVQVGVDVDAAGDHIACRSRRWSCRRPARGRSLTICSPSISTSAW